MAKITQLTVKEMYEICKDAINRGMGDKYLIAPSDNEGNSYHGVFYGISKVDDCYENIYDTQVTDKSKLACIG